MKKNEEDENLLSLNSDDMEKNFSETKERETIKRQQLIELNLSYDELLAYAAEWIIGHEDLAKICDKYCNAVVTLPQRAHEQGIEYSKIIQARNGGNTKAKNDKDGKGAAKKFINDCWSDWQLNPKRYKTQSLFALDVLSKIDVDEDQNPVISFDTIVKKVDTGMEKQKVTILERWEPYQYSSLDFI